jgi:hypothetical protein
MRITTNRNRSTHLNHIRFTHQNFFSLHRSEMYLLANALHILFRDNLQLLQSLEITVDVHLFLK